MTFQEFLSQCRLRLNPQQQEAVQAVNGSTLLLAVPGSGKTTVLVTRLGYMILALGIPARQILTMTYTVAATEDMRRRFQSLFGETETPEFRTINGVSARIIQTYERLYQRTAFRLIPKEEQSALVSELYLKQTGEYLQESSRKTLLQGIAYVKNQMLSPKEIESFRPDRISLAPIYRAYCAALREKQWMDYDDQLVYALQILKSYPEVLATFRNRYRYLCVDEAQDTSKIQHEIIHLLSGGNLFMVGDEDQSIYGFRAAYPQALVDFPKRYPGSRLLVLEQNYRSTQQIVAAADRFIRENPNRHPKNMTAVRGSGNAVHAIRVRNRTAQYRYLVQVAERCSRETAVLYRNNESALPLIDLLERAGLPYRCNQFDTGFFTHATVQDIQNILQFARSPKDGTLFLKIYYKLSAGISKAAAENAVRRSAETGLPIFKALLQDALLPDYTRTRCRKLHTELSHLWSRTAAEALYRIEYPMGYREYLASFGIDPGRLEILRCIGENLPSPGALLERLAYLEQLAQRGVSQSDSPFLLSTIHSAKGLEYDRVYLADVLDGILPGSEDLEEERRLFYVGMTRAINELHLFRFSEPGLHTPFTDEVFHPRPRVVPQLSPKQLVPGTAVTHVSFGQGIVIRLEGKLLTVRFGDDERIFALDVLNKTGFLMLKTD